MLPIIKPMEKLVICSDCANRYALHHLYDTIARRPKLYGDTCSVDGRPVGIEGRTRRILIE